MNNRDENDGAEDRPRNSVASDKKWHVRETVDVYVDNREPTPCELLSEPIACLIMASDGLRLPESTFRLEYVP